MSVIDYRVWEGLSCLNESLTLRMLCDPSVELVYACFDGLSHDFVYARPPRQDSSLAHCSQDAISLARLELLRETLGLEGQRRPGLDVDNID